MAQKDATLKPALKTTRKILPSPSDQELKEREKGFLLDGTLLSRQANDETDRCNPSHLNFGIPQYNALKDPHLKRYLKTNKSLPKSFQQQIEDQHVDTMQGALLDRLTTGCHTLSYIKERNTLVGAGYSRDLYGGHSSVITGPPNIGYHGEGGYRRNTPDLRRRQSVFDDEEHLPPISLKRFPRTLSAPATLRLHRQNSAKIYTSKMIVKPPAKRAQSAITSH